ncbi:hypothetical protein OGAPHI_003040 [Ogataea philodendri]|uniref:Uncharacterized protein n=1 Tax=Ogataea philodendri TaxID=1378263 RepID=A0A9P8P941_9ASCO|nr:uncharacterized protein OGAPHI_003040 [Ogataea philodendri]KAH3667391.1 hypothetical protein OGAPHI_003040 [Ogataea philodendri]
MAWNQKFCFERLIISPDDVVTSLLSEVSVFSSISSLSLSPIIYSITRRPTSSSSPNLIGEQRISTFLATRIPPIGSAIVHEMSTMSLDSIPESRSGNIALSMLRACNVPTETLLTVVPSDSATRLNSPWTISSRKNVWFWSAKSIFIDPAFNIHSSSLSSPPPFTKTRIRVYSSISSLFRKDDGLSRYCSCPAMTRTRLKMASRLPKSVTMTISLTASSNFLDLGSE